MAYKYTTLRPSVETNYLVESWDRSANDLQKVAYAAHTMLPNDATNQVILTAKLLYCSGVFFNKLHGEHQEPIPDDRNICVKFFRDFWNSRDERAEDEDFMLHEWKKDKSRAVAQSVGPTWTALEREAKSSYRE